MAREKLGPRDAQIGIYLRELRIGAGFSEKRVAQELDIKQQLVSRQEHGLSRLSVGQLLRLATLYGKSLAQLIVELALDSSAPRWANEPAAPPYEVDPVPDQNRTSNDFAREPFLLNFAQLRDPAERQAVLDLFNRFAQRQNV
ncbi:MAG: XRE family transcriptional regulator [Hyphomicrobiales bacterium]|nr:MAG: XRE family transcriptional regulator [Hyphomicrobiales bacterium]